jgi:hypothetical protein
LPASPPPPLLQLVSGTHLDMSLAEVTVRHRHTVAKAKEKMNLKSGRTMHWQLLLVAVAAAVLSTASGHSALFDEFAGEDGQLSVGEVRCVWGFGGVCPCEGLQTRRSFQSPLRLR